MGTFCPRQETKMRLLVAAVLVAATSAAPTPDADPQFIATPYVYPYQPAVQTVPAITSYTPSVYSADPGFFVQLPAGGGKYLPDVFGWERGSEYYKKWLGCPTALCKNRVKWRTDGQRFKTYQPGGADPNKFTDKYSDPGQYQGRKKRDAEADPQYFATQFVDPMTGAKGYYPVVPATSYVQPTVQTVQTVQPQVSYVQAAPQVTPQVRTVYTADPMFFNFGRYFNNNLGGKADYGHDAGRRKSPTYGDYYRTHRYPLNDGWMLWDEDLRDLDSKSNKIGLGKDGGR